MEAVKRTRKSYNFLGTVCKGKSMVGPRGLPLVKLENGKSMISLKAALQWAGLPEKVVASFITRIRHRSHGEGARYKVLRVKSGKVVLCAYKTEAIRILGFLGKELSSSMDSGDTFDLKALIETIGGLNPPTGHPKTPKVVQKKPEQPGQKQMALDFDAAPAPTAAPLSKTATSAALGKADAKADAKAYAKLKWLHERYQALAKKAKSLTMTEVATYLRVRPSDLMEALEEEGLISRGARMTYKAGTTPLASKIFLNPGEANPRIHPGHLEHFEMLQYSWKMTPEW